MLSANSPGQERNRRRGVPVCGACVITMLAASSPAAEPELAWEPPIGVATGDARRGPWRMNESRFLYVDDPSVAIDAAGGIAVVWVDQARQDIFLQRYGADGQPRMAAPVNVSRSSGIFSWLPRLVVAGAEGERIYVLWQEIVFSGGSHGGEIYFSHSSDGGVSFTGPLNLSRTTAGAGKGRISARYWHNGSLDLAIGPQGELYAAWTEYEGPLRFARSTDGGKSFSAPMLIAGGASELPARGPSLASSREGQLCVAWAVGEDPAADIQLACSADRGASFGTSRAVSAGPGHADAPKLVAGGTYLHLVYAESPDGPNQRYEIRYTRALLPASSPAFDPARTIAGGQGQASIAFPSLALHGDDHLYLLWEQFPARQARPRGLGYATSGDGGDSFSAPSQVPGSADPAHGANGGLQGLLMRKLAVGPTGRIAVVNSTYASGDASRIWLYRGWGR